MHKTFLTRKQVRERYNCADRTIARWAADPNLGFPAAITVNGRWLFDLDLIEGWERSRASSNSKAA